MPMMMGTGIVIPIINIVLAVATVAVGVRTYLLIRQGLLGPSAILFALGALFFATMQISATMMRTGTMSGWVNWLHDLSALLLIVCFLAGFVLQVRVLTQVMGIDDE